MVELIIDQKIKELRRAIAIKKGYLAPAKEVGGSYGFLAAMDASKEILTMEKELKNLEMIREIVPRPVSDEEAEAALGRLMEWVDEG